MSKKTLSIAACAALLTCAVIALLGTQHPQTAPAHSDSPRGRPAATDPLASLSSARSSARRAEHGVSDQRAGYATSVGRHFVFDVSAELRTSFSAPDRAPDSPAATTAEVGGAGEECAVRWSGKMRLDVVDRRAERLLAELSFRDVDVSPVGPLQPDEPEQLAELGQQMEAEMLALFALDGRCLGYRFPASMDSEAQQWTRTIVAAFQFVLPPESGAEPTWETVEADTTGEARVRYRWLDGGAAPVRFSKQKLGYLEESLRGATARTRGRGEARWDADLGWIDSARVDDALELESPEVGLVVHYALRGELRLEETGAARAHAVAADWEGPWESPGGAQEELESAADLDRERMRDELAGADLQQLLRELTEALELHGMDSYEVYEAMTRLAALFELDPSQALELEQLLLAAALEAEAAEVAVAALGQAATREAQGVLSRLVADALAPESLRAAALRSAFQLPAPDAGLVQSVLAVFDSNAPLAVEGSALLLLGRFANATTSLPAESSDAVLHKLLELEARAATMGISDVWLEALGNAGGASALPQIVPYLYDPAAHLRAAALSALRDVHTQAAADALLGVVHQDAEPGLRAEAVRLLAQQDSPSATQNVCDVAQSDGHALVRKAAILALADHLALESARSALEWCAEHDPAEELRDLAQSILAE